MIAVALIIAALIAGAIVIAYWKNIAVWIKKAVEKIIQVLGFAIQGVRTFITKLNDGFQNKSKYYNENKITGEWEETVYTKTVSESEVPSEILAKIRINDVNVEIQTTEELRLAISA